ncbi:MULTISPECIES: hypothetical protein [unclassified Psychrobacter]|uniref:hypothetical protein n=1 Tax=unclassified Psychrobacter TaxID=196806 RepID=UPI0018F45499|nr:MULTISPECIES: hypothetical protein [unclassified Psychrobacter]
MDIFNNREIAVGFWLSVTLFYIFLSPKMTDVRTSLKHLLSAFFVKQIMSVLLWMIVYISFIIFFLYKVGLWNTGQIKNTVFWCVSFSFTSLFKIESIKEDKNFFKNSVIDSFKLLAILQFIIGVYTFSVWIEILLIPVLVLMGAMLAIAEKSERHNKVKTLLNFFIFVFGIILITYTLYMLTTNFSDFGSTNTAYDFFIPPLLTLLYLPFVFFMILYSTYELVFVRLQFSIKSKLYRNLAKIYALVLFNIRMSLLDQWSYYVVNVNIKSHADLIESFQHIFKMRRFERNPLNVPVNLGWNPYRAKEFLSHKGLNTGFYNNNVFEHEWFAVSRMQEFSDGIFPDNITYYVEGSEEVVKVLKLKVNVNDAVRTHKACGKLEEVAEALSISSLSLHLSEEMKNAILGCQPYSEKVDNKTIALIVEYWSEHEFNGFHFKFTISSD